MEFGARVLSGKQLSVVPGSGRCMPAQSFLPASLRKLPLVAAMSSLLLSVSAFAATAGTYQDQAGYIKNFEIVSDTPAFNGAIPEGGTTAYRVIKAIAHGELNPGATINANIVNLDKAPKDKNGNVAYATDVVILTPANAKQGKRAVVYEVANRGTKLGKWTFIGGGKLAKGKAPDGQFLSLLKQGYTIVWSGWQGDLPLNGHASKDPDAILGTQFPTAHNADGSAIVAYSREEYIPDVSAGKSIPLSYAPANPQDVSSARLSVRQSWQTHYGEKDQGVQTYDAPSTPVQHWHYVKNKDGSYAVEFTAPEQVAGPKGKAIKPDAGAIYSFEYKAKDPRVNGIGFASVRDLMTFLREQPTDASGHQNPLNGLKKAQCITDKCDKAANFDIAIGEGISQSGRYLRGYLYQGFNRSVAGKKVFEGLMPIVPGGRRIWMNYEFSQPGRWSRAHEDHFMRGFDFPYAYNVFKDPISGKTDGILKQCQDSNTCPKIIQLDGSFEWWGAGASLVTTDGKGHDLTLPGNVRYYMVAGAQHTGSYGVSDGYPKFSSWNTVCALPDSAVDQDTVDRALMQSLIAWVAKDQTPPASAYPLVSKGQAVRAKDLPFPNLTNLMIPAANGKSTALHVPYAGQVNSIYLTSYKDGVPHVDTNKAYQLYVPNVDKNGNETSGVVMPELQVPLATYMGWNYRKPGHAVGEACDWFGSSVPLAATKAQRSATDTRASLDELYSGRADYQKQVAKSANSLVNQGYLLPSDAQNLYIKNAANISKNLITKP